MTEILATRQQLIEDGAKKDETIRKLEAKIEKYETILLNREKSSSDDMFLIYKNDFGEDSIDIIGRNIREFGEKLYLQGYKLIARQESNLDFCIYMTSFDGRSNFNESIKMIETLIEEKRKEEEENENNNWPMNRIIPKINNVQQTLKELKEESKAELNEVKNKLETTLEKLQFIEKQTKKNEERRRLPVVHRFYQQKKMEYIRNSPIIMEKMCMRLSVKNDGDSNSKEPPFKDVHSVEDKKKELNEYFDFLQKKWEGSTEQRKMQDNISCWMATNWYQLLYKPTTSEKDEWKIEMEKKLKERNIIGNVCYMNYKSKGSDHYLIFCIANSKIICWDNGSSKEYALKNVHSALEGVLKWDTTAKFATDMDVSADSSNYFVHVSTEKIVKLSDSQKVVEWIRNNFQFLKYSIPDWSLHSIPSIYSLALEYFEESME